eukprot:TRINITY_DN2323_c0_g2_i10.p1 TRINITY_DN2323_c0_g2~~TRINITY_DN2323_c0_g2_i10.p1  ORF type:complete len:353 (+),score=48.94 TRINITY_DN2323_c0_g2_i10:182-1240(+)
MVRMCIASIMMERFCARDGVLLPIHCSVDRLTTFRVFVERGCLEELEQKDKFTLWKRICESGSAVMWECVSKYALDLEIANNSEHLLPLLHHDESPREKLECASAFEMLDIEIQLMILQMLDVKILCRLAQVNKKFNALTSTAKLWRSLYLQTFSEFPWLQPTENDEEATTRNKIGNALLQNNWKKVYKIRDANFFDAACGLQWKDVKMAEGNSLHDLMGQFVALRIEPEVYVRKAHTFLLPQKYLSKAPEVIFTDMHQSNVFGNSTEVLIDGFSSRDTKRLLPKFLDKKFEDDTTLTLREVVADVLEVPSDKVSAHAMLLQGIIFGTLFLSSGPKAAFVSWFECCTSCGMG